MDDKRKEELLRRHLKQAGRSARRKEREGFAAKPDKGQPKSRGQTQDDEGWNDARPARGQRKRSKPKAGSKTPRSLSEALVISVARGHARVWLADEEQLARLAPSLRGTSLVVGDRVLVSCAGTTRIESLLPRQNLLSRPDVGNKHRELPIAANVDLGVIVAAHSSPPLRPGLIDRYLIALERGGVAPLLCINKMDLCADELGRQTLEALLAPYRELGLPIAFTAVGGALGATDLIEHLAGKTAVLVGHSGVGKSSLLSALGADPGSAISGAVREFDGRGRHTTSASSLQRLPHDIQLIDTPGVRAFGLWGISPAELRLGFPGFGALPEACRFRNCAHRSEPGCAVRAAVELGELSNSRYHIYLRMLTELKG